MKISKLRTVLGAGEVDDVLALRIDVVRAAVAWRKTHARAGDTAGDAMIHDENEERLYRAVGRYNQAVNTRAGRL